jgi:hypothetical protein
MAIYTTTKCGNCGKSWETLSRDKHSLMGPPVVKCSFCGQLSETGFKLYSQINWFEKIRFWLSQSFRILLYGFGSIAFGLLWLNFYIEKWISGEVSPNSILDWAASLFFGAGIPIALIFWGISELKEFRNIKKTINLMEEKYRSQGGFIDSNQWF